MKFALNLDESVNTASYRIISEILEYSNIIPMDKVKLSKNIRRTQSTKLMTYLSINPLLTSPNVYQNNTIEEYKRIQYTRARLSSHYLRVETGQWSRMSREEKLCTCGNLLKILGDSMYTIQHSEIEEIFRLDDNVVINFIYEIMQKTKP